MRRLSLLLCLVGCGGGEAVVVMGVEAREAGVTLDRGSGPEARALPFTVEADREVVLALDGETRALTLRSGDAIEINADLAEQQVDGEALAVRGEREAVALLAHALDAKIEAIGGDRYAVTSEDPALLERAAGLDEIDGVVEVRTVSQATLDLWRTRARAPASSPTRQAFGGLASLMPLAVAARVNTSEPQARRWVEFFSHCNSRLPVWGGKWRAFSGDRQIASGITDHLGLITIDDPPPGNVRLEVENGQAIPRPYDFALDRPETYANVTRALESQDFDTLLYGLEDAAKLARPEWRETIAGYLNDPRPGVWILAAAALGSYDGAAIDSSVARAPVDRRMHLLHAAGVAPMSMDANAVFR
jgi:hypothetical protein